MPSSMSSYRVDFTFVRDAVEMFYHSLFHPNAENQVFNVSSQQVHTYQRFLEALLELYPNTAVQETGDSIVGTKPIRGRLSIDKASNLLGYVPRYDLKAAIIEHVNLLHELGLRSDVLPLEGRADTM